MTRRYIYIYGFGLIMKDWEELVLKYGKSKQRISQAPPRPFALNANEHISAGSTERLNRAPGNTVTL
jgi:hypothetical protein